MKITVFLLLLLFVGAAAFAHAPSAVDLSYNPATGELTIVVKHNVGQGGPAASGHRISDVTVTVNGKRAVVTDYSYQQFAEGETAVFKLSLKKGDRVSVRADCSIAGFKTAEYTVP